MVREERERERERERESIGISKGWNRSCYKVVSGVGEGEE